MSFMPNKIPEFINRTVVKVKRCALLFFTCALTMSAAIADDTEILFTAPNNPPNVLFVLDTSGSMGWAAPQGGSRLAAMKAAIRQVVNANNGVNMGIMNFARGSGTREPQLRMPLVPVDTNRANLIAATNSLVADGGTPTVRAMYRAMQYFQGAGPLGANSPITSECQDNHIVVLTDGVPTEDTAIHGRIENLIGGTCAQVDVGGDTNNGTCGVELANYMNTNDMAPWLPGESNITTHVIGFNIDNPWLPSMSSVANGVYANASNTDELTQAFRRIFDTFTTTFASPTVTADSFNPSRHRSEVFYSLFEAKTSTRWNGNVKSYRIVGDELRDRDDEPVVDNTGQIRAGSRSLWADAEDGENVGDGGFASKLPRFTARYWYTDVGATPEPDGTVIPYRIRVNPDARVTAASMGAGSNFERNRLVRWAHGQDIENRNWTQNNNYVADTLHSSPVLLSYWAELALSGVDSDGDGIDDAQDVDATGGTDSDGDGIDDNDAAVKRRNEVVFYSTNMGSLHAIDAQTGIEQWAYTPSELLPNIKAYYDNANTLNHTYGLDGKMTLHVKHKPEAEITNGHDYEVDTALLYLTERRGGDRVYALDVSDGRDGNVVDPFKVLWKIDGGADGTQKTDPVTGDITYPFKNLAQTWSKPEIVTMRMGCPNNCEDRDLLLFSGGYNPLYDDVTIDYDNFTVPANGHGNAVYLVDPHTGELVWSVGNGAHHTLNLPIEHSVPAAPVAIDSNYDGSINTMYFGDISGDVWRIDFAKNATDGDDLALSGGQIAALSPAGESLRFFNRLDVVSSGTSNSSSYYYITVGSGMRSSPLHEEPSRNAIFSIKDNWVGAIPYRTDANGNRRTNYEYVDDGSGGTDIIRADPTIMRDINDTASTVSSDYGFYHLLDAGEKVLEPTVIHRNHIFAVSYVPPDNSIVTGCGYRTGYSQLRVISLPSGVDVTPGDAPINLGEGLLSGIQIFDNGSGPLKGVTGPGDPVDISALLRNPNSQPFRTFRRTGWIEE